MTTENLDSSIAFKSSDGMGFPHSSTLSSLNVEIFFSTKASYRRRKKLWRVSSPLKLRKTSKTHLPVRNEKVLPSFIRAIGYAYASKVRKGVIFFLKWNYVVSRIGEMKERGVRVKSGN